jgi:hypothetical protein
MMVALLAGAMVLGTGSTARATVSLTLHEAGYTDVTVTGVGAAVYSGAFGDFTVSIDSGISLGSTPSLALLSTTTNSTRNTAASTETLTVSVTDTYLVPATPTLILTSSLSSTLNPGTLAFQSSLNTILTTTVSLVDVIGVVTAPNVLVSGYTIPYTLDNTTTITLGAGLTSNSTGTTQAIPSPEPATLASLVFTALPLAGLAFWRRRKARA